MTIMIFTIIKLVPSYIVAFVALMNFIREVHQDKKITATSRKDVTVIVVILDLTV